MMYVNERKNIQNDCVLIKINNSNIKKKKIRGNLRFLEKKNQKF